MKSVVCFALLAVASATSVEPKAYLQSVLQPSLISRGSIQYQGDYQTPLNTPSQFVQYKTPLLVSRTSAPAIAVAPAVVTAAVPKPLLKQYQVNEPAPRWAILRSNLDDNFNGHYQYEFETENGISHSASAAVKQLSPKEQAQVVQGQYSYISPEGQVITTRYTADENGFVVQGDHLPVAPQEPELPPYIAKSLAYIRSLPPLPENQQ